MVLYFLSTNLVLGSDCLLWHLSLVCLKKDFSFLLFVKIQLQTTLQLLVGSPATKKHSEEKQLNKKYSYEIRFPNTNSKKNPQIKVWHNFIFFFLNTFTSHLLNECDAQICSHSLETTPGKSYLKRLLKISCAFFG